jgi:uncharacterized protein YjiS (DUF1127 family)
MSCGSPSCSTALLVPAIAPGVRFSVPDGLDGAAARLFSTLVRWRERARQRHALLDLDDRILADIGITRAAAEAEARKPFWL